MEQSPGDRTGGWPVVPLEHRQQMMMQQHEHLLRRLSPHAQQPAPPPMGPQVALRNNVVGFNPHARFTPRNHNMFQHGSQQPFHRYCGPAMPTAAAQDACPAAYVADSASPILPTSGGLAAVDLQQQATGPVPPEYQLPKPNETERTQSPSPESQTPPETPPPTVDLESKAFSSETTSKKRDRNQQEEEEEDGEDEVGPSSAQRHEETKQSRRSRNRIAAEVMIPCRARNMPEDHNVDTAVIIIPDNVKHGDNLSCTHPICKIQGAKFRYCAKCKLPAARRSFRRRHHHGESAGADAVIDNKTSVSDGSGDDDVSVDSYDELRRYLKRSRRNSSGDDDRKRANPRVNSKGAPTPDVSSTFAGTGAYALLSQRTSGKYPGSSEEARRRVLWNVLLDTRPDRRDEGAMKSWLDEVVDVSERGSSLLASAQGNNQANVCEEDK